MITKEYLQYKYIKLSSQKDYETVTKVLEKLGITQYSKEDNKYKSDYSQIYITDDYKWLLTNTKQSDIPIQEFYDFIKPETKSDNLTIDDLVEGEIYRINHESNDTFCICRNEGKSDSTRIKGYYISNMGSSWEFRHSTPSLVGRKITIANTLENKHLQVSIKQNKFIKQEDLDLYDDATFELKALEVKSINMFKKGDYIVVLSAKNISFRDNYCFKQREDANYLRTELDSNFSKNNGLGSIIPTNTSMWRYATSEEITEYNRLGKPYDVTALKSKPMEEDLIGRYLKALKDYPYGTQYEKGSYIKLISKYTCEKGNSYSGCLGNWERNGFELMPKGWTPETKVEEWIPKVGDWAIIEKLSPGNQGIVGHKFQIGSISGTYLCATKATYIQGSCWQIKDCRKLLLHEIPQSNVMDKKELLRIAREKYPIGTIYCSAKYPNNKNETVKSELIQTGDSIHDTIDYVYHKGNWAKIIDTPTSKSEEKWQVGGWAKIVEDRVYPEMVGNYCEILSIGSNKVVTVKYPKGIETSQRHLWQDEECEWIGMTKPIEFKSSFPEKWCVKNVNNFLEKLKGKISIDYYCLSGNAINEYYYIKGNHLTFDKNIPSGYTEVTYQQFVEHFGLSDSQYYALGTDSVGNGDYSSNIGYVRVNPEGAIPLQKVKVRGFDEKEYQSNPFNQILEVPKKNKTIKKQLILT